MLPTSLSEVAIITPQKAGVTLASYEEAPVTLLGHALSFTAQGMVSVRKNFSLYDDGGKTHPLNLKFPSTVDLLAPIGRPFAAIFKIFLGGLSTYYMTEIKYIGPAPSQTLYAKPRTSRCYRIEASS